MNYLAHLYLSAETADDIAGALLGDFAKGRTSDTYPAAVRMAIARHRAIDRYTDQHPLVHASRALVSAERRRFSPILVDIFYDHFLVRHWTTFSGEPLAAFTNRIYGTLRAQRHWYPQRLREIVPPMIAEDWLGSYGRRGEVSRALDGIARRLGRYRRAAVLRDSVEELDRSYQGLEQNFLRFFPQLVAWARNQRAPAARST